MNEESSEREEKLYNLWYRNLNLRKNKHKYISRFYSIFQISDYFYEKLLFSICSKRKILEYGCGSGSQTIALSKMGENVIGFDISKEAINLAKKIANDSKLENIKFYVMDAKKLRFENNSFDIIFGRGILHHLPIDIALEEIVRVLNSEGKVIFYEPMGINPLINIMRKLIPHFRTIDEHPLVYNDLKLFSKYFKIVKFKFFHLVTLIAIIFHKMIIFPYLLKKSVQIENILFKMFPHLKLLAWQVIIMLEKPIS